MRRISSGPGWINTKAQRRGWAHTGRSRSDISHWELLVSSASHQTTYSDQDRDTWDDVALCREWRSHLGCSSVDTLNLNSQSPSDHPVSTSCNAGPKVSISLVEPKGLTSFRKVSGLELQHEEWRFPRTFRTARSNGQAIRCQKITCLSFHSNLPSPGLWDKFWNLWHFSALNPQHSSQCQEPEICSYYASSQ